SPTVLEFVGDELVEQGKFKEAKEVYAKGLKVSPKNVGLDRKHATMIFKTANTGFGGAYAEFESTANAKVALILTILVPGLGQVVTGEFVKGAVLFSLDLLCWIWAFFQREDFKGLIVLFGAKPSGGTTPPFHGTILIPMIIGAIVWLIAVGDS